MAIASCSIRWEDFYTNPSLWQGEEPGNLSKLPNSNIYKIWYDFVGSEAVTRIITKSNEMQVAGQFLYETTENGLRVKYFSDIQYAEEWKTFLMGLATEYNWTLTITTQEVN